ncbi:MAG: NAD(P)H-hydrate epimerase [Candidatus Omnitrophota bacterium]|nr:NAD(P)H-hydrate epimerase [Candidatus Omnitrophota bacterium]
MHFFAARKPAHKTTLIKSLSTNEIRKLEAKAKHLGLEERILIENASGNLANIIDGLGLGKKVLVVAGRGNNGADTLACARKLLARGYCVRVVIIKENGKELNAEVNFQKEILEKINTPLYIIGEDNVKELNGHLKNCDFVIDGILGIGIKGGISNFLKKIIETINASGKKIVACDIPSGLSPDEGISLGAAIKADYTVTFIAPKQGFFLNQGKDFCGKIFVVDIGVVTKALENLKKR